MNTMEKLIIAGKEFNSRLFLGTGKFNSNQLMEDAILASDTEMVREDTGKYGTFKKAVNRIKTGRWGNWEDLITEMDGHGAKGHL